MPILYQEEGCIHCEDCGPKEDCPMGCFDADVPDFDDCVECMACTESCAGQAIIIEGE